MKSMQKALCPHAATCCRLRETAAYKKRIKNSKKIFIELQHAKATKLTPQQQLWTNQSLLQAIEL
jgi:hypothetical protein